MKILVCCAIIVLLTSIAMVDAQQPCRVCNAPPAQSSYQHFSQPLRYRTADGSYHDTGNHRRRDVVRIVDVAQINPAYVSSYSPDGYDSSTQADILAQIRTLSARLDQLTALAAQKQAGGGTAVLQPTTITPSGKSTIVTPSAPVIVVPQGGPAGPVTVVPSARTPIPGGAAIGIAILNAKCAACHQAGKLLPEQKFTLLDAKGNLVSLTDKQKLNVLQKTYHKQMPPPQNSFSIPEINDSEFAALADLLH